MKNAEKKVVLHAGDYFFGKAGMHVHTLLGSCISITLWHPRLRIGGMCHFALPRTNKIMEGELNPRYAEDCIQLFKRSVKRKNTRMSDYQVKVFGGGNLSSHFFSEDIDVDERRPIGGKNTTRAYELLLDEGVDITLAHVGEFGYRRIVFDISTGDVWVRFTEVRNISHHMTDSQRGRF